MVMGPTPDPDYVKPPTYYPGMLHIRIADAVWLKFGRNNWNQFLEHYGPYPLFVEGFIPPQPWQPQWLAIVRHLSGNPRAFERCTESFIVALDVEDLEVVDVNFVATRI